MLSLRGASLLAAVFAWVLLQPPLRGDGTVIVDAPLRDWVVNGRFQDHEQCENTRSVNMAALAYALEKDGGGGGGTQVITLQRCISLERLKEVLKTPKADDDV